MSLRGRRHALQALALPGLLPLAAWAQQPAAPAEVLTELPQARLSGSGRLTYFGLRIYDSRLWVEPGFVPAQPLQQGLALELVYARALEGPRIAARSLDEMKRVGSVSAAQSDAWLAEMTRAFPDVQKNDRLTGVLRPAEGARFYLNGQLRHEIRDAAFAALFFGIWLSPRTSEPALRRALLGLA